MNLETIDLNNLKDSIKNIIHTCFIRYEILQRDKQITEDKIAENTKYFLESLVNSDSSFDKEVIKINNLVSEIKEITVETKTPSGEVLSLQNKQDFAKNLEIFTSQIDYLNFISNTDFPFITNDFYIYQQGNFKPTKLFKKKDKTNIKLEELNNIQATIIKTIKNVIVESAQDFIAK